jgi:hypothetical protein
LQLLNISPLLVLEILANIQGVVDAPDKKKFGSLGGAKVDQQNTSKGRNGKSRHPSIEKEINFKLFSNL